ncbi:MAG: acyl-CoA dehydrogenase [Pseudomonadales bacterium]|nr:acyl-CoA dehydrogenase [Pseudomonadales bacterium]MCP5182934.1 acyl-CoA dehydrogenase [Pseudomonadales bacterium]
MNEQTNIIVDTATRMFADGVDKALLDAAETGVFPVALWQSVLATGFHSVGSPDSGTGLGELYAFLDVAGASAVPLPLADTLFANAWAGTIDGVSGIGEVAGETIVDVPWGRVAERVIGVVPGSAEIVVVDAVTVLAEGANMAGEPRDTVALPADARRISLARDPLPLLALARAAQSIGALRTVLQSALGYAGEREQFGRTLSNFQAIQHSLAVQAAEVAAARRAVWAAVDSLETDRAEHEVAVAKARVGEAASLVCEAAHQVFGAIGYTHEHRLHHFTRRAWAWREEYGNETFWQQQLGLHIARTGADNVWSFVTGR